MATRYQYYNSGDDASASIGYDSGKGALAQTFTPALAHRITSVKLKLYRAGSPGTMNVSIRATSGGVPTGGDLCLGTINGNSLTTSTGGAWYEIPLSGYDLQAGVKYAIVCICPNGDYGNVVYWRMDNSSPTYSGGNYCTSANGGVGWSQVTTRDFMFEDWGEEIVLPAAGGGPGLLIAQGVL